MGYSDPPAIPGDVPGLTLSGPRRTQLRQHDFDERAPQVHHDTLVLPAGTSANDARDAAERKARQRVSPNQKVSFVYLHGNSPVPDDDAHVEWRYSYQQMS